MSNIKKGSKLTVSTANGISRDISNNVGVLEVSGPGMSDVGMVYGSNPAHFVIGSTDVSGILQLGINQDGNTFIDANTNNNHKDIIMQKYGGNIVVGSGAGSGSKVGIQTNAPNSTVHINSTDGIIIPVGTDGQRPDPAYQGMMRYNTTTSQFEGYGPGSTWGSLGGVKDVDGDTRIIAETSAGADNDALQFYTAGQQRLEINSAGNVGIGVGASSSYKLNVNGSARATNLYVADKIYHEGDANTYMSFGSDNWKVVTNDIDRLIVNNTGVGIGKDPSYKLDVNGAAYFRGATYLTSSTYLNGPTYLGSNYLYRTTSTYDYFGFPGAGRFGVVTNSNWRFWIKDNGYVGIGTTDPGEKLEVNGNIKAVSIYMDEYVYHKGNTGTLFGFPNTNEYIVNVGGITTLKAYIDGGTAHRRLWTPKALYVGQWSTGTNLVISDHQVLRDGGQACFFNYSGTGLTYVGNTSNKTNFAGSLYIGGIVGIGTNNPRYPLDVDNTLTTSDMTYWNRGGFGDGAYFAVGSFPGLTGSNYGQSEIGDLDGGTTYPSASIGLQDIAAHFKEGIYISDGALYVSSDERIKTNIVDVSDNIALEMVRNIPCRYYNYKDKISRGAYPTIGFIAQEVRQVLPMAVSERTQFIPNEMRNFDGSWNNNTLYTDLSDCSGVTYRFYVSNEPSGNDPSGNDYGEIRKDVIGNGDNSFTFDTSYDHVFCYGKQVDDFHTLDKHKLFALNFSATQEIDRKQLQEIIKVQTIQTDLSNVNTTIQQQATTIQQQAITIQQQATEISTLETQIADILTRLSNLENPSSG